MAQRNKGIRALTALWLVVILALSLSPENVKATLHTTGPLHNLFHFAAFLVAALLFTTAPLRWLDRLFRGTTLLVFALATEYLEAALYVNRIEWRDVRTDGVGILCGLLLAAILSLRAAKQQPAPAASSRL